MSTLGLILMVDDNECDCSLVREALQEIGSSRSFVTAESAAMAQDYLLRRGAFADVPRPDLILLDINLGSTNGYAFLSWLKSQPELRAIPVVMFTSTQRQADVARSRTLGALRHVAKPVMWEDLVGVVKDIDRLCAEVEGG